jgi:hypothetical protein
MKLKHRCSVINCKKCGRVSYDKIYLCKMHNPVRYFKENPKEDEIIYECRGFIDIKIKK